MILSAIDVVELQYFLMDGARRYVATSGTIDAVADDLLASAAALDYALLLSSEHANETLDDDLPVAASIRSTLERAALAALDIVDELLAGPPDALREFLARHGPREGIFATIATLRVRGALTSDIVAFRALTVASDVLGRR